MKATVRLQTKRALGLLANSRTLCLSIAAIITLIISQALQAMGHNGSVTLIESSAETETISVPLFKSRILQLNQPTKKISIGNENIADVLILRSSQLYIQGKDLGTTNVLMWDNKDRLIASLNVEVSHDLNSLKAKLHELLPSEKIEVYSSQGSLVLSGQVSSLSNMDTALKIADSYSGKGQNKKENKKNGSPVINLMGVGGSQQVMLKVTVAEMSRTVMRKIGFNVNSVGVGDDKWSFGGVNGGATFPDAIFNDGAAGGGRIPIFGDPPVAGPVIDEFAPTDALIESTGLFASFLSNGFLLNAVLDASKENGSARVLAEPTLTTLTGKEAKFLSGGEFPIPVPRGDDGVTIEFKEFGVGLTFLPVVLDAGRINLNLNISVSELASANSVALQSSDTVSTFFVPSLTVRSAYSTVELGDGQTIGIAGLINESTRDVINKFPGLGDVPVLGHLFRSQEFEKGETELVILVTPQLAQPIDRTVVALPTDNYVEPSDMEFYLLGRNRGLPKAAAGTANQSPDQENLIAQEEALPAGTGGVEQSFGHALNHD